MTTKKIISLNVMHSDTAGDIEERHERLERAGFMRMTQLAEPRLSELITKYKTKGYEVEIVPVLDEDESTVSVSSGGCAPSSCSSASASGGCSSGGSCSSGAAQLDATAAIALPPRRAPRKVLEGVGTIFIRMSA
jgi:hypothetical protein